MHDGPAQSLTNIVLQAQIVERLVASDPASSAGEVQPARRDGPADARRDEDLHLRRPADGPRRPRPRPDAPAGDAGAQPRGPTCRSSSNRWDRTAGCRWTSRAACSGCSTRPSRGTSAAGPGPGVDAARLERAPDGRRRRDARGRAEPVPTADSRDPDRGGRQEPAAGARSTRRGAAGGEAQGVPRRPSARCGRRPARRRRGARSRTVPRRSASRPSCRTTGAHLHLAADLPSAEVPAAAGAAS